VRALRSQLRLRSAARLKPALFLLMMIIILFLPTQAFEVVDTVVKTGGSSRVVSAG
jgi:hypothetical protein